MAVGSAGKWGSFYSMSWSWLAAFDKRRRYQTPQPVWPVGTRFRLRGYGDAALVFTVTRITPASVKFRAVGYDSPQDKDRSAPIAEFRRAQQKEYERV